MGVTNHLLNGMILKKSDAFKKSCDFQNSGSESQGHLEKKTLKKHTKNSWKKLKRLPKLPIKPRHFIAVQPFVFEGKKNVEISTGALWKPSTSSRRVKELGKSELYWCIFGNFWLKGERATFWNIRSLLLVKIKQKKTRSQDDLLEKSGREKKKESSFYCALGGVMLKFKPYPFGGTVHPQNPDVADIKKSQNESPSRCTNTRLKGVTKSFATHMSLDFPRPERDLPSF